MNQDLMQRIDKAHEQQLAQLQDEAANLGNGDDANVVHVLRSLLENLRTLKSVRDVLST